jgi:ketosteroid isomerase-like protein
VSKENLEIVRRAIALRNRREFDDMTDYSPEVVYRPMEAFSGNRECRGAEEFRRFMEGFYGTWADDFTASVTTIRDYGDVVSLRAEFSGHARASGIPISGVVFEVLWLRDGLITRIEDFATSAEALKAVGLKE